MKPFTETQEKLLLGLSIFGLIVPNGVFLYYALASRETLQAAMANPVSLVFIIEAFVLMFLFAWLIHRQGIKSPGWLAFVAMSLVGSMIFSVPACLYLASRKARQMASVT
ncbi:MAG: hypothetical protein V4662_09800 [Verrucomicrobiota bacterium]